MGTLTHEEARRAYDRIGPLQDSQAFYEDRATQALLDHAEFGSAESVFELGCGTGRFALRLFEKVLPASASYRGVDVSPRMVRLAQERLAPYSSRAEVVLTEGGPPVEEPAASYDRFASSYVFDLLSEEDIRSVLREAHRILRPGGLLCASSLSRGAGVPSRVVARIWGWVQARAPSLVGGCRPIELRPFLSHGEWKVRHDQKVVAFAVPSEVLIAERR